jgi:hypothetical protein
MDHRLDKLMVQLRNLRLALALDEASFGSPVSQENPGPFPGLQTHALNYPRARKKYVW